MKKEIYEFIVDNYDDKTIDYYMRHPREAEEEYLKAIGRYNTKRIKDLNRSVRQ